jgi:hypothetical protein
LITIFSAWALAFITLIMHQNLTSGFGTLRQLPAPLGVVAILGLLLSLAEVRHAAWPLDQIQRLRTTGGSQWKGPAAMIDFIQAHSRPGERMVISCPYGHVIALEAKVTNVLPFSEPVSLILRSQLDQVLAAMNQNHVDRVFGWFDPEFRSALNAQGFLAEPGFRGYALWTRPSLASCSHASP